MKTTANTAAGPMIRAIGVVDLIAAHTVESGLPGILETTSILETESGEIIATSGAHAKNRPAPIVAVVTDPAEVNRLAYEILAAKRPTRPAGTEMLRRSRAMQSTTAGG